jgi:hypothetical protein
MSLHRQCTQPSTDRGAGVDRRGINTAGSGREGTTAARPMGYWLPEAIVTPRSHIVVFTLIAAIAAALLATLPPATHGAGKTKTSKSLAFATYKEQIGRVTVIVGSFPAALNETEPYIPLQVAVGVRGRGETINLGVESFQLIDRDGNIFPIASFEEFRNNGHAQTFNPEIMAAYPLVTGEQFATSFELPSSFFSTTRAGVRIDHVELHQSNHIIDVLYFPRPMAGLDDVLTLRVQARGIPEPINVRFEIPLKGKRRAEKRARSD